MLIKLLFQSREEENKLLRMEKVAVAKFFSTFHPHLNVNGEFSGEQTKLILQYCSFSQLLLLMSVLNGH